MVLNGVGFTEGTIILDEPEAVYYSGQWVSGNVQFELPETITYSAINLVYLGEAEVQQIEKQYVMSGGEQRCREVKYDAREQYINFMHCVSGGTGALSTLPSGTHAIPFQFQVPFEAPSSFSGEVGNITYKITAYLEYPEPGRREQLVKEFKVVAPIRPSTLATMMPPLVLEFEDIQSCKCFCAGKPVNVKISLPSAALPAGAKVPVSVEINDAYAEIYEICFMITRRTRFRTVSPRSEYTTPEETLVQMRQGPLVMERRRAVSWPLQLPPVPLPNLETCSIIDVVYFLKVSIQLTGCKNYVEEQSEVVIGVLPPNDTFAAPAPELASQLPKAPLPEPNQIGLAAPPNAPPIYTPAHAPHQYDPLLESAQKTPYNIGFTTADPTLPPYSETIYNGYPYPGKAPSEANAPYPEVAPLAETKAPYPEVDPPAETKAPYPEVDPPAETKAPYPEVGPAEADTLYPTVPPYNPDVKQDASAPPQ